MPKISGLNNRRLFSRKKGGYFAFIVKAIKNTIVKNIILNMYFFIVITSLYKGDGITAGA